jgi:hypothetical protein
MDKLQSEWAAFNKVPLVTTGMNKINDTDFISLSKLKEAPQDFIPRYELWRKQYRNSPYLRSLADEAVLIHGAKLFNIMTPHFLKGGSKIPFNKMTQFMEGWTHFLEEASYRGLDLKRMPTRDFA